MGTFQDVVLGFDFGEVRIGVAVGNGVTASSNALTIVDGRTKKKWEAIAELIREVRPVIYGGRTIDADQMKVYIDKMNEIINHI